MWWGMDQFFKNKYRPMERNHCFSTLSCSSKTSKSMNISTSTSKNEGHILKDTF